jgi:hypothetical protein
MLSHRGRHTEHAAAGPERLAGNTTGEIFIKYYCQSYLEYGGLDTDYVVHINDGTEEVKPIVLRLLPGEETIFELRVVNHGDPSNISVDASPPLIKAMRLKRSNHYVELEEVIPVLARMPENVERVDGELLVTGESGTSRVPISLVSEAEDSEEEGTDEEDEADSLEIKGDYVAYDDEDKEEDSEEGEPPDSDIDSSGGEDYRNYRTPPSRRTMPDDRVTPERRGRRDYGPRADNEHSKYWSDPGSSSLDGQDYNQPYVAEKETPYHSLGSDDSSASQELSYPGSDEVAEDDVETKGGLFGLDIASEQIVPIIMFFLIIVVLALTFYTSTIPEFLGALTSSILIVTLIIYGAATLLKA